jgi:hypothetical protein
MRSGGHLTFLTRRNRWKKVIDPAMYHPVNGGRCDQRNCGRYAAVSDGEGLLCQTHFLEWRQALGELEYPEGKRWRMEMRI